MNLDIIEESHLLAIKYDHNSLYIELTILAVDGAKYKFFAHNKNTSPIQVQFIGLSITAGFTTYEGRASLGEIESVNIISNTSVHDKKIF
jgi:hypothetical protein